MVCSYAGFETVLANCSPETVDKGTDVGEVIMQYPFWHRERF